jgi:hypothetical protein
MTMKVQFLIVLSQLLTSTVMSEENRQRPPAMALTVMDTDPRSYRAQAAIFGYQFDDVRAVDANLMLPPDDPSLCEFPPSLYNISKAEANLTMEVQRPIALLVSRGKCNFDDKARVGLALREHLTSLLKYMIIYNNRPDEADSLVIMSSPAEGEKFNELNAMGFLFISSTSGADALAKVQSHAETIGQNSTFRGKPDESWYLPIFLEVIPTTSEDNSDSSGGFSGNGARQTFSWLRFVLFGLLIISPCARAGYLWYSAGGRLMLRRNEQGRITGIQYIRPMPYWFASGGELQEEEQNNLLTEEQVGALPKVVYRFKEDDVHADGDATSRTTTQDSTDSDSCNNDAEKEVTESLDIEQPHPEQVPKPSQEQMPTANEGEDPAVISTTCTMCSICIDDFNDGEQILVLPRCRHGFHMDCIKPWLIERQGCCPLCKTNVLSDDNNGTHSGEEAQDSPA